MRSGIGVLVMGSVFAIATAMTDAAAADMATVSVSDGHLVGPKGMSLYLFEPDKKGASTCYDKCATAWPPLAATGQPTAGEGAKASLLGTAERKDGSKQVTYGGWPLYYFVKDQKPGDTLGQEKNGFGGEWYLVEPSGEAKE